MRSRRLEVLGEKENGRARGRLACLLLARPFFLVPTVPTTSKQAREIVDKFLGTNKVNYGRCANGELR